MVAVHPIGDGVLFAPWRYFNAGHRTLSRQAGELLKVCGITPGSPDIPAGYGIGCLDCDVRGMTAVVTRQQNQIRFSETLHVALRLANSPCHVGKADQLLPRQLQDHLIAHIVGDQTGVALCSIYGVCSPEIGKVDIHLVSTLNKLPPHFSLLPVGFSQLLTLFSLLPVGFSQLLAHFSLLPALFRQLLALFSLSPALLSLSPALLSQLPVQLLQGVNNLTVREFFIRTIRAPVFEIRVVRFWRDHADTF